MLSNAHMWQRYSFDLTPFAGQTIELRLGVFNDGQGGQTALYVDNASLITLGPSGDESVLAGHLEDEQLIKVPSRHQGLPMLCLAYLQERMVRR